VECEVKLVTTDFRDSSLVVDKNTFFYETEMKEFDFSIHDGLQKIYKEIKPYCYRTKLYYYYQVTIDGIVKGILPVYVLKYEYKLYKEVLIKNIIQKIASEYDLKIDSYEEK